MQRTDVVVIGGGLSGLCVAHRLAANGTPFQLNEARNRLGGRIKSVGISHTDSTDRGFNVAIDLGPSWFWPGQQQIAVLIKELDLESSVYEQSSNGDSIVELTDGTQQTSHGTASMSGSWRIDGGMQRLIDSLHSALPEESVQLATVVQSITRTKEGLIIIAEKSGKPVSVRCNSAVLALPPRVVSESINFEPALPSKDQRLLDAVPTWMAAQAKFVAVYTEPFWQLRGLSGDGFSQVGPLMEIHDASPRNSDKHALFGFVGVPSTQRAGREEFLKSAALEQLVRLFGTPARHPVATYLEDWAFDTYTATPADRQSNGDRISRTPIPTTEWNGRIVWAGSETASQDGQVNGYLEGAVQAGNRAAQLVS